MRIQFSWIGTWIVTSLLGFSYAQIGPEVFYNTSAPVFCSTKDTSTICTSYLEWQFDSLEKHFNEEEFKVKVPFDSTRMNVYGYSSTDVPSYTPEIYAQRIKNIPSIIPLTYNEYVQDFIDMYVLRKRHLVRKVLGMSEVYFPLFEQILDREGMPIELKYLAIVESALNPHAVSRVGATGLWQFMLATAKMYGLEVNSYVDERRDPVKATEAAIRYFKNMYKIYGDWLLVIAAYNCGPGNVNKAIVRSGGKHSFWEIMPYLPYETRGYVPCFIAACYVFNYPAEHNLYSRPVDLNILQDTIQVRNQQLSLQQLSFLTKTDYWLLRDMNPELKLAMIPYSSTPYVVKVPYTTGVYFTQHRDSIRTLLATLDPDSLKSMIKELEESPITKQKYNLPITKNHPITTVQQPEKIPAGTNMVKYTVKPGDIVGSIAEKYGVYPSQVAAWNNLYKYQIKVGQVLTLYTNKDPQSLEKDQQPMITQNTTVKPTVQPNPVPVHNPMSGQQPKKYHKVQPGDTLWGIANKYPGATVDNLMKLNNLKTSKLDVGQLLVIQ